jgi:AsmA protein
MDLDRLKRLIGFSGPKDETKAGALRRYLRVGAIALGVVILILLILPLFINVNNFRPKVESEASAALGRQVTVGELSLSIFSGSVSADDIAIADDPAFSQSPFLMAKSLKIGVELMPLIFSKELNVTDITLNNPQITILNAANGKWNFSSIGNAAKKQPSTSGSGPPANLSIAKLSIRDGKLSIGTANSTAKPAIYNNVNVTVTDFSPTSKFPLELTAKLPGSGDADISGKAGPIDAADASRTPLDTPVKIKDMNVAALGFVDSSSGIAGLADFDGTLNSDGHHARAVGLFTGRQLKFSAKGSPSPKVITVRHAVDFDLDNQAGTITQGDIAIGGAQAHLTGTFQSRGESEDVNLKLNAPGMPVDELEPVLPAVGVILPSGSKLRGGTLSADLAISGPINKPVISGPVQLSNTQLANFNLGSKLGALQAFSGHASSSRDTSIQNASLNARVAPEGTRADNINVTLPALGVITGSGTVSPSGALAFKMVASLSGGAVAGLTKVAGVGGGGGSNQIPFAIEGTTSDPKFVPDVTGVATSLAKNQLGKLAKGQVAAPTKAGKSLGGLLGPK